MNNVGTTMQQYGIELITVEIKRLDLPDDNKTAVYERMISERNNIAASYTAEGEAEYMRILSDAYSDEARSDFYTFVLSLDAAKASLVGTNKTLILNSDSPIAQIFNTIE